jgi:hypothetical protein
MRAGAVHKVNLPRDFVESTIELIGWKWTFPLVDAAGLFDSRKAPQRFRP